MSALTEGERELVGRLLPGAEACRDSPLVGGLSNRSVVLDCGEACYLLRFRPPQPPSFTLGLEHERRVLEAVAAAGLGPEVIASDAQAGLLISEFLSRAQPWDAVAAKAAGNFERIALRLRALHAVAAEVPPFEPIAIAEHYAAALASRGVPSQPTTRWYDEYCELSRWYLERFEPTALCHDDLVADNVLDDGASLWLIDFEYACRSHPVLDLASLAALNGFGGRDRAALCAAYYHGRAQPFTGRELDRVVRMQELLAYFWAAWSCAEEVENSRRRAYRASWASLLQQREQ
jgi:thiamine kinase-like enzyme